MVDLIDSTVMVSEDSSKLAIVIPAYNEAASIGEIIARARAALPGAPIVVVDDGSTDGTGAVARDAGAEVLTHPYNKGNGAAVKTALRALKVAKIIIIDADGQHPPEMIPTLAQTARTHDLVVGARTGDSTAMRHRKLGNWLFCTLASFLSERDIPDLVTTQP